MLYFVSKLGTFYTFLANPQQNPPKTTVSPKTTQAAILTTAGRTLPVQNVTKANQYAKSTTAAPTRPSITATTPTAPNFGDDPQTDDPSGTIALNLLLNWARLGQTPPCDNVLIMGFTCTVKERKGCTLGEVSS